jgi:hypothetical protein
MALGVDVAECVTLPLLLQAPALALQAHGLVLLFLLRLLLLLLLPPLTPLLLSYFHPR